MTRRLALLLAGIAGLLAVPAANAAERAWVKDEVRLNVRTGPGLQYRIVGAATTGDSLDVLSKTREWTQVRGKDLEGWIPVGYLQSDPPARIVLEKYKNESEELSSSHGALSTEVETLRTENAELSERSESLDARVEKLERENIELRAGSRWPDYIAGACILFVGGVCGMIVQATSSRRTTRRIRL
jgi:SH3 domain protein